MTDKPDCPYCAYYDEELSELREMVAQLEVELSAMAGHTGTDHVMFLSPGSRYLQ